MTRPPLLYEVHTRQWLAELGAGDLSAVTDATLDELASLGTTHLWLMGIWPSGPRAREIALRMKHEFDEALPGWRPGDVAGSPYSVADYRVAPEFGGDSALASLRARLHRRGIAILLDFVPNHVGIDHAFVHTEHVVSSKTPVPESFRDGDRHVANGKDPYFPAWIDTAQVEYRRAKTRAVMRDILRAIADRCDGLRCDMAMLVLPEVYEETWKHVPFDEPAADFWDDAITHVRSSRRDFLFLAEAYWGLEPRLVELGFDCVYDKGLYDYVVDDAPAKAASHLWHVDNEHRAHFLENHDEPRAAKSMPFDLHRAAALLVFGLPGMRFLHHGQLDGARRFARIQLRRRASEPVDASIRAMYTRLLAAIAGSSVGQGDARLLAAERASDDNPTHAFFVIVKWSRDLVVVNLAPHRAQCRVHVPGGGRYRLVDRLGDERWDRDLGEPLFLDLPARGAQLFELQRIT